MEKKITLGSGKLYCVAFTDGNTIPDDATIETDTNLLGLIKGGATLTYSPEFYVAEDDLGIVKKKMLTQEEAVLKSGIMTWNGNVLSKLCQTAKVSEDTTKHIRTVKIGGVAQYADTNYVLHFVHEDAVAGDCRITIVGSNEAGFELAFAKDAETVINAEFKAVPMDDAGTLIVYTEEDANIK